MYHQSQREYLQGLSQGLPVTSSVVEPGDSDALGRIEEASLQGEWLRRLVSREWTEWHEWHRLARLARIEEVEPDESALVLMYERRAERKARKGHLTAYDLLETLYMRYRDERLQHEDTARREPTNDGRGQVARVPGSVNATETRVSRRWKGTSRRTLEGMRRKDGTPFVTPHERKGGKSSKRHESGTAAAAAAVSARLRAVGGTADLTSQ